MPGIFSRMGTYMAGAMGNTGRRTLIGAAFGGTYGAMSDNTSIIGGAMMGAGLARYGGAAVRRGMLGYRGIGVSTPGIRGAIMGANRGIRNRGMQDYRRSRVLANRGYSKIRGIFR